MNKIKLNSLKQTFDFNDRLSQPSERQWSNAGRYTGKRIMKKTAKYRLWSMMLATMIVYFWLLQLTIENIYDLINFVLVKIQSIFNLESLYLASPPSSNLIPILGIYLILSPWILDVFITQYYHLDKFPQDRLESRYPETCETINRYCQKYHRSPPQLKIIQTQTPLLLTYGIPFKSRIVISNGLLQCLTDEELATLYATQLGYLLNGDVPLMSLLMTLLQIPYLIYWQLGSLGEQFKSPLLRRPLAWLAALFYSLYWFWKWPTLWLSRQRVYDSDRFSIELTKNPNALSRALLKTAISISEQIVKSGYTPRILESFDILLPVDVQQVLSLGSLSPEIPFSTVIQWEYTNPQRHWLALFSSHPLLGDRLYLLGKCAQFWHLDPELKLVDAPSSRQHGLGSKIKKCYPTLPLIPQALVFAVAYGLILRCLFWGIGKFSEHLNYQPLVWMYTSYPLLNAWVGWLVIVLIIFSIVGFSKRFPLIFPSIILLKVALDFLSQSTNGRLNWLKSQDPILEAWVLIALSVILILGTNRYFPSPQSSLNSNEADLADLLSKPDLPYQGQYITLSGRLLGHSGLNWLGQDLILQTDSGLIKLHFLASLGWTGELLSLFPRPLQYVNQLVTVRGWLRRGASPYLDVELMTTKRGEKIQGGHQMFVTLLALACGAWGAYKILKF